MGKDVAEEAVKQMKKQGFDAHIVVRKPHTKKEQKQIDEMNKKLRALGLK